MYNLSITMTINKEKRVIFKTENKPSLPTHKSMHKSKHPHPIVHSFGGLIMSDFTLASLALLIITGLVITLPLSTISNELYQLGTTFGQNISFLFEGDLNTYGKALSASAEGAFSVIDQLFCSFLCDK